MTQPMSSKEFVMSLTHKPTHAFQDLSSSINEKTKMDLIHDLSQYDLGGP